MPRKRKNMSPPPRPTTCFPCERRWWYNCDGKEPCNRCAPMECTYTRPKFFSEQQSPARTKLAEKFKRTFIEYDKLKALVLRVERMADDAGCAAGGQRKRVRDLRRQAEENKAQLEKAVKRLESLEKQDDEPADNGAGEWDDEQDGEWEYDWDADGDVVVS